MRIAIIIIIGNYKKAKKLFRKLLNQQIVELGESRLNTLITMNNLASTYKHQGLFSKASAFSKRSLSS